VRRGGETGGKEERLESSSIQKNAPGYYKEAVSARKTSKASVLLNLEKLCLSSLNH